MIHIIDGMPGAGKTQFTLSILLKRAKKENRQVYYHGIPELNIPEWHEIENPELWDQLPDGSIIVLDEAQRVFKLRPAGSEKPQRTVALETHRHKGHDLYLITQDGTLLDIQCRKLCNSFFHLKRLAGMGRVSVTEYAEFVNHNDYHERKKAIGSKIWKHDKKIWKLYKSATVHTVKRKLPAKLLALPVIALVAALAIYDIYDSWFSGESHFVKQATARDGSLINDFRPGTQEMTPAEIKVQAKLDYFESYKPRIKDQPETAPVYDQLRTVQSYPRLQCLETKKIGCACYTQQATRIEISENKCKSIIKEGTLFDNSQPDNALILANTLDEEQQTETLWSDNVAAVTNEKQILVINTQPLFERQKSYTTHDRGFMNIDKVVKTDEK